MVFYTIKWRWSDLDIQTNYCVIVAQRTVNKLSDILTYFHFLVNIPSDILISIQATANIRRHSFSPVTTRKVPCRDFTVGQKHKENEHVTDGFSR